ncbi:MAG: hypothetical protein EZS26_000229 [Candidatus Ordinivivax streblomastigis]|uniref:Uncharacterized protein n=1 Tax=Candidatus Ordinivivax streblomastigis TaxID=2540710 RepID=A0A5M8P5R5_9BACT|nr:MAG: hypothetical protein EZS26_000229 [Candidatus Ordinivivax streblomastigis]
MEQHKSTISKFLLEKAKSDLLAGIEANRKNLIDEEVKLGINVNLLLGVALEGIINHLGEQLVGKNNWNEIEKSNPFTKWFIILKLNGKSADKGQEPLLTIFKLSKLRNRIAHPKLEKIGKDIMIVAENGEIIKEPNDDCILPQGNSSIYFGYEEYVKQYNINETLKNMIKVLKAIKDMADLLPTDFTWSDEIYNEIKEIKIK